MAGLTAAAVALIAWCAALRTACPTISHDDSGEFVVAAWELGVAHPPGYPLTTLVHALALHLPAGSVAFRLTLVSSASFAASAAVLCVAVTRLPGAGPAVGAAAALTAALAAAPWSQATSVKGGVYLAVSALLAAALSGRCRPPGGSGAGRAGFLAGLAVALHWMTAATFLPALAATRVRAGAVVRRGIIALLAALPALSLVIVLPICAVRRPFLNWGDPVTAERLAFVVGRSQYAGRLPGEVVATGLERLAALREAVAGAGPVLPLLLGATVACLALARSRPAFAAGSALGMAGMAGALLVHGPLRADSPWYFGIYAIPALQLLAALAVAAPALAAAAWRPPWRRAGAAGSLLFAAWCLTSVPGRFAAADRSREFFTWDLALAIDRATAGPRPAILFAGSDPIVFGNWHRWRVEGGRAGAAVVPVPLLPMPWLGASFSAAVAGLRVALPPPRTGAEAVPALLRAWSDENSTRFERYTFLTEASRAAWPEPGSFAERGPVYRITSRRAAGAGTAARALRSRGLLDGALHAEPRRKFAIQPLAFSCLLTAAAGLIAEGAPFRQAERCLRLAAAMARADDDRAAVALARGNLAARDRRLDDAAARYTEAERLSPGHPGALRNLAMIMLSRGMRPQALEAARRLREAAPESPEAAEVAPLIRSLEREVPVGR